MHSAIYEGWVRHRRYAPRPHTFQYSMFMMYLDLSEIDRVFKRRLLWSSNRPAPAWFRRDDHSGDPAEPLDSTIRSLVRERACARADGPIRLLTHLRYFGYIFNPVSLFYCFDESGTRVETIVAEITNTPWKERYCYVLPEAMNRATGERKRFRFPKSFHISPFMGMDQVYDWSITDPGKNLGVHMMNYEGETKLFDATMHLRRTEITTASLARVLVQYPLMTAKVIGGIYWNALRLKLKGTPFHPYPEKTHSTREVS